MNKYTATEDGRYFIVDGRKWRATDPNIPDPLKSQLISVLMKARRDVGKAKKTKDSALEKDARTRVSDAKIALGERGPVWWESYEQEDLKIKARSTIFTLLRHRDADKSICPSEVARTIGGEENWRSLMPAIREVAVNLAKNKKVSITRGKDMLDPEDLGKGPIRIRRGARFRALD